ncbi:MAG TPA: hypothetical protein VGK23_01065 [Methanomassiliicoccales archaeon]|jgi:hypothetical protein
MSSILLSPKEKKFLEEAKYRYNLPATPSERVFISRLDKKIETNLPSSIIDFLVDLSLVSNYYSYKNPEIKNEMIESMVQIFYPTYVASMIQNWMPKDAKMELLRILMEQNDPREIMGVFTRYLNDCEFHDFEDPEREILVLEDDKNKIVSEMMDFINLTSDKDCIYRDERPLYTHDRERINVMYFVSKEARKKLALINSDSYSGEIKYAPIEIRNALGKRFGVTIIFRVNWIKAVLISLFNVDLDGSRWWDELERGRFGIIRRGRFLEYQTVVRSEKDIISRIFRVISDLCNNGIEIGSPKLMFQYTVIKPDFNTAQFFVGRGRPIKTIGGKEIIPYDEKNPFQIRLEKEIKRAIEALNEQGIIKRKRGIKPNYFIPTDSLKAIRDSGVFHKSPDDVTEKNVALLPGELMITFDHLIQEIDIKE